MVISMAAIGCSFVYTIIIAILYFTKKKVNNFETKIYNILVILSLINMFLELHLCANVLLGIESYSFYNMFLNRLFLIMMFSWITIFTMYAFTVSFNGNKKIMEKFSGKKKSVWFYLFCLWILICLVLILVLRIDQFNDGTYSYSFGPATDIIVIIYVIYFVVWFFTLMFRSNKSGYKKYFPLFLFVGFSGIALLLRQFAPGILLNSLPFSFAVLLMYFTIENPDLKMLGEITLAKEEAERANNAKSDFLSSMSHEIRTPINAILGAYQILIPAANLDDSQRGVVQIIGTASDSLLDIITNVLDMSKIESGNWQIDNADYKTKELFESATELVKLKIAEKGLDFKINIAHDIPRILHGDKKNLKKSIVNILSNAVKYTDSGTIEYDVKCVKNESVCRLYVTISDTGRGIKREDINKLFAKFERLDEKNTTIEGTGLGLAITQTLIEKMGGTITVLSDYGTGSKFVITLDQKIIDSNPIGNELNNVETGRNKEKSIIEKIDLSGKTILIVDDNKINLKIEARLIGQQYPNAIVETVLSGQECLDKIMANEKYDLILMDDMMPVMSGQETFKKLKSLSNFNIPTIMLTANAVEGAREEYLKQGFNDYLSKPVKIDDMNKSITKVFKNVIERNNESLINDSRVEPVNTLQTESNNETYLMDNKDDIELLK